MRCVCARRKREHENRARESVYSIEGGGGATPILYNIYIYTRAFKALWALDFEYMRGDSRGGCFWDILRVCFCTRLLDTSAIIAVRVTLLGLNKRRLPLICCIAQPLVHLYIPRPLYIYPSHTLAPTLFLFFSLLLFLFFIKYFCCIYTHCSFLCA